MFEMWLNQRGNDTNKVVLSIDQVNLHFYLLIYFTLLSPAYVQCIIIQVNVSSDSFYEFCPNTLVFLLYLSF